MDCSVPNTLPSFIKSNNKPVKVEPSRQAAIDQAIALGLRLTKEGVTGNELEKAGAEWAVKAGWAEPGSLWAATLGRIVRKVIISSETGNPIW